MLTLVWIGIILVVAVTFFLIIRQPQLQSVSHQEIIASGERSLFTIQVGDIICYEGDDWCVEGRVIYDASGYNWIEYLLFNGTESRWLSIEQEDLIEVLWFQPINSLNVNSNPQQELNFNGNLYRCIESGKATIKREGNTQNKQESICTYYDYESEDNRVLAIEIWGNEIEVMAGKKIPPRSFDILPGDGKSIYN